MNPADVPDQDQQPIQNDDPKIVLNYISAAPKTEKQFSSWNVIGPFAVGAAFPLLIAPFFLGFDSLVVAFFVDWGLCGILLFMIRVRGAFIPLRPDVRPWSINFIAGAINVLLLYGIILETTGRHEFWPWLGMGGSVLAAYSLSAVVAFLMAWILTPSTVAI